MQNVLSQEQLCKIIIATLGESLTEQEIQSCLKVVEIIEPKVAKLFWQVMEAKPGIFIVLEGKARLLDGADNLITTLSSGASFSEQSLFREQNFLSLAARASTSLKLGYIPGEVICKLMEKYPQIRERLYKRAEFWDILLLCRQNSQINRSSSTSEIFKALCLFERYNIEPGGSTTKLFEDNQLLLLRQGELKNAANQTLLPGNIYVNTDTNIDGKWEVTQPTIAYSLKTSNLQLALTEWNELIRWINPSEEFSHKQVRSRNFATKIFPKAEGLPSNRKIIPFPSPSAQKQKTKPYFPSPKIKAKHIWERFSKQYPFYAQQSASDCGCACLVMIARYWGKRLAVNRVRDIANVNRSGASLRSLAAAAENIGFSSKPVKASFDKLAQQSLPAIVHWEGKHYIVVYEINQKHVIVCDPAIGQRNITHSEFKDKWTGYALLLQPTLALKEAQEETGSVWRFYELIKPHSWVLFEVFMASILLQVFGLITPLFTQLLLDRVIVQGSVSTLNAVGLGLLIFGFFSIAVNGVRQYLLYHTANRISVAMLVGFLKHTFSLPLSYFESRYVGDITSRIQENGKIQSFLTGETLSIVLDLITIVVYLAVMFWYNWQLTLLVLLIVPPFFILALASTSILRKMSREIFNASAEQSSYLIQSLTGIRSVRSMAIEHTVRWKWEELLNNVIKKSFRAKIIGTRLQIISGSIDTISGTALLWYGAYLVIQNQLTIGQLIAFNMLMGNVISPFKRLSGVWNQFQEIMISTERINDVLEAKAEEDLLASPRRHISQLRGHIRFDNVTFRYHPESEINVLENLSFEIMPEQMIAVVGRSGSGKTTLSKLILGLYPPTEGKVLIDGHDVSKIALKSLRRQIGVVDQNTFLFGGTIRENISVAHPEASLEEITEAARLAGADEFIQQLPMGYENEIGEGGGMLSGGQRQRLVIARALLGNPQLLIFDEATSSLDAETERIIQNNLKTILKGRTSLIIAHRLSTVRNADLILVLDKGVLIESGTHDELIAKKGHYYYLNQQQLSQAG
ncbi:peptidase domain-containing ABC transporter [Plectonema cf. radiosum LEGE 06105]|uniref:Peptidase domain-containing ABC transporter n=1 Tax=Plectonema cf. radiosum LEGE 06105 TaxID=945769 RepID=A0A8J7K4X8_9CYAN|nr:peptidase domain-containing ABC transporter [Plectonema radiosum]MBE9216577.1 peptidase domain-containing ABC transporter [Plectonema cf. radiosum LEGE 06105]